MNLFSIKLPHFIAQSIVIGGYIFLIIFGFFIDLGVYRLPQILQNVLLAIIIIHIMEAAYCYSLANASKEKNKASIWTFWTLIYGFMIIQNLRKEINHKE